MLRLAADENFNGRIVRGLRRQLPDLDLVRIQDSEISGADDPSVLEWAAREGRIVLTHDVTTMTAFAYDRLRAGKPMPGIVEIRPEASIGQVIEDLVLLITASEEGEYEGQILYLPL